MKITTRFRAMLLVGGAVSVGGLLWTRDAAAEHFDMLLRVEGSKTRSESYMDTSPPLGGVNKRPVVKAKPGESLRITWRLKSGFPHGVMKSVTVHFFIVKEAEIGQKPVPDPTGDAGLVDNTCLMDFQPKSVSTGFLKFRAPEPGNYLIRVQSEDTHQEHDHEHFSAIDLQVEP